MKRKSSGGEDCQEGQLQGLQHSQHERWEASHRANCPDVLRLNMLLEFCLCAVVWLILFAISVCQFVFQIPSFVLAFDKSRLETDVVPLGPDIWLEQQFPDKEWQCLIAFAANACSGFVLFASVVLPTQFLFETFSWSLKSYRLVAGQADGVRRLDR